MFPIVGYVFLIIKPYITVYISLYVAVLYTQELQSDIVFMQELQSDIN